MRPRRRPADPYATLGLAPGASRAEVRQAYRRLALAVHPDLNGSASTDDMARLNHARDELLGQASPTEDTGWAEPGMAAPRARPERPPWASAHEAAWPDYWSAWNELPQRATGAATGPSTPPGDPPVGG